MLKVKKVPVSISEPTVSKISLERWSYGELQAPKRVSHHSATVKSIYFRKIEESKPSDST